jgi:hypothetical protein
VREFEQDSDRPARFEAARSALTERFGPRDGRRLDDLAALRILLQDTKSRVRTLIGQKGCRPEIARARIAASRIGALIKTATKELRAGANHPPAWRPIPGPAGHTGRASAPVGEFPHSSDFK